MKIALAVSLILLIVALSVAALYKIRADRLHGQWMATRAEADELRRRPLPPPMEPSPPEPVVEVKAAYVSPVADPEDPALRDRVRELEAALAEKDRVIWDLQVKATNRPPDEARRPRDQRNWMEELRQSDPARYEEIQKRREERQQQISDQFAQKAAYFLKRDTSKMAEAERESYSQMLQLLDETWRMAEQLRVEMPREERRALSESLHEKMDVLNPLLQQERTRTFMEAGLEVGYSDEEAAQFAEYLNTVIDLTSPRGMFRGGPPGREGSRRGGSGAPAAPAPRP
ncbi:MAG: hypothetical protein KKC51_02020 [Verrucomicrobia bacterium]|nr:hypothetical protein [Verrucomicrobiota bacterium]